jgi:hypothetical protein
MTAESNRTLVRRVSPRAQSRKTATWAAALAALACAGPLVAHHSNRMFEPTAIWVKGTVVRSEPANPHAWIVLEETADDGRVQRWTVEGPIQARLDRMGVGRDFLQAGDVIAVCGFALQGYAATRGSGPDPYRVSPNFVHGHMLVFPDGRKRLWGPYGKLGNCVRPDEPAQAWVDFLNTDPLAWEAWCVWRNGATSAVASSAFLDEVKRSLGAPCYGSQP